MKLSSLALVAALAAAPTLADDAHHPPAAAAATASDTVQAEVRKVDTAAGKITLRHEALTNLGMPPMTMVFAVRDAASLGSVKQGDRVVATIAKLDGAYTVTRLEPAK